MGSRSLNEVMIIGNVGEEPRFTFTNSGVPVCTFSVATNRSWLPKGATERRQQTQWHYMVTFSKLAEICSRILTRGTKVFVSGRIKSREIINPRGEKVRKTEIIASDVIALDKRKSRQAIPTKISKMSLILLPENQLRGNKWLNLTGEQNIIKNLNQENYLNDVSFVKRKISLTIKNLKS